MARLVVTIDGPAASGKSTVARMLAGKLNATFLDTGAMYRAATVACLKAGVDLTSAYLVIEVLNNTQFEFISSRNNMLVSIDGIDVTDQIRDPRVITSVRYIAANAQARRALVGLQRRFAEMHGRIVTEGRDQGTVAFPRANVKFFLIADLDERATIEQISAAIEKRDKTDRERSSGPLKPADDAITIDSTDMKPSQVVDLMLAHVNEKCPEKK